MSVKAIVFCSHHNDWTFPTETVTTEELGKRIALALSEGKEWVSFEGSFKVTVNYLLEALRFRAKYGWFYDSTDLGTGDHKFDPNRVTPGSHWARVQELRAEIRMKDEAARLARAVNHDMDANEIEESILALRQELRVLLHPAS